MAVNRAEISSRLSEHIFSKRRVRLHEERFSLGDESQPGLKFRKTSCNHIYISTRAEKCFSLFPRNFKFGALAEISARAEIRHV